jgi:hypothetical protein
MSLKMFQVFWDSVLVDEMKPNHHPMSWASIYPISWVAERLQLFHFPFSETICLNFPIVEVSFAVLHRVCSVRLPMDIVAPEIHRGQK